MTARGKAVRDLVNETIRMVLGILLQLGSVAVFAKAVGIEPVAGWSWPDTLTLWAAAFTLAVVNVAIDGGGE